MSDILGEYQIVQNRGGLFELPRGILKISGPDSVDFLHRMTTQNVKNILAGHGANSALLQSNAMLVSIFSLYNTGNFFLLLTDAPRARVTIECLEKFHFAEDVEIKDVSNEFKFISAQGKDADHLSKTLGQLPVVTHHVMGTETCFVMKEQDFGLPGYHLVVKRDRYEEVLQKFKDEGLSILSLELWGALRAEAGYFTFGVDVTEKNLILEGPLADYVNRGKGCYPGQEVVERVFTYGNVAKKLVGLKVDKSAAAPVPNEKIFAGDKEIGVVTSVKKLPWNQSSVALGIVRRPFYNGGQKVAMSETKSVADVIDLPYSFHIEEEKES